MFVNTLQTAIERIKNYNGYNFTVVIFFSHLFN